MKRKILPHNKTAYDSVIEHLSRSNRTCVVHPTGTGKSIIALELIEENPDARILFVTSYAINLLKFWEKVEKLGSYRMVLNLSNIPRVVDTDLKSDLDSSDKIESSEDSDLIDEEERLELLKKATEVDESFMEGPLIQFCLYYGLENLLPDFDLIILDEFHRAGAPLWEKRVESLLSENQDAKVVGFSATPVRANGKDMRELFFNDVAAEMQLSDAIVEGLLPLPMYWLGRIEFEDTTLSDDQENTDDADKKNHKKRRSDHPTIAKRHLESGIGLREAFQEALIPEHAEHGKFIVFCRTISNTTTVMKLSEEWFDWVDEVHRYEMNYKSRDGFQDFIKDESDSLRLLFVVDMLNEGIHIKDLDGVFMVRPTESERIYFQQLGRALAVTTQREHPLIFDIVSNAAVMKGGMDFWKGVGEARDMSEKEMNRMFHITAEAADFITYLEETEYDYYAAMKSFYEEHGHLYIPAGYKVDGHNVYHEFCRIRGNWNNLADSFKAKYAAIGMDPEITTQWMQGFWAAEEYFEEYGNLDVPSTDKALYMWLKRNREKQDRMCDRQKMMLDSLGMDWTIIDPWEERFEELVKYKEKHGHTDIPGNEGALGRWVAEQRKRPPEGEKKERLDAIGFEWDGRKSYSRNIWRTGLEHAQDYYASHNDLKVPAGYVCSDGYKLGNFIKNTKQKKKMDELMEEVASQEDTN